MPRNAPRWREALPYAVMLAVSAALYAAALRIEVAPGGRIGPAVWPKAVIVAMGLLCAWEMARRLLFPPRPRAQASAGEGAAPAPFRPGLLAGGIALVAAYVLFVPWLGFFIATALFLAGFPIVGGMRRPALAAAIGLGGSFLLVVLFMRVAYISLPLGEGPFRAVSLALIRLLGVT